MGGGRTEIAWFVARYLLELGRKIVGRFEIELIGNLFYRHRSLGEKMFRSLDFEILEVGEGGYAHMVLELFPESGIP